jgi:hypothetical protein
MQKKEQESLIDALVYCSLRDLPDVDDGIGYWLEALAKVAKRDGSRAYVYVARNDETLEPIIKKDFGSISGIAFVEEYYPYEYLREEFIPSLANKEEKVKYLAQKDEAKEKEYSKMSVKKLDNEIIRQAIKAQKEFDNKNTYYG